VVQYNYRLQRIPAKAHSSSVVSSYKAKFILGWSFFSGVLIGRSQTEDLVEQVAQKFSEKDKL